LAFVVILSDRLISQLSNLIIKFSIPMLEPIFGRAGKQIVVNSSVFLLWERDSKTDTQEGQQEKIELHLRFQMLKITIMELDGEVCEGLLGDEKTRLRYLAVKLTRSCPSQISFLYDQNH
jgi:hypothetical protein